MYEKSDIRERYSIKEQEEDEGYSFKSKAGGGFKDISTYALVIRTRRLLRPLSLLEASFEEQVRQAKSQKDREKAVAKNMKFDDEKSNHDNNYKIRTFQQRKTNFENSICSGNNISFRPSIPIAMLRKL
jgi:hypothetical protein